MACYGDNGIVIDKTNEKLFAGTVKYGQVFEFEEISSIESETYQLDRDIKYMIHINTRNFDLPRVSVTFAGERQQTYAKLRAALNIA